MTCLAFSPDGNYLASGGKDKTVKIWNLYEENNIPTILKHTQNIYCIVFSPDSKYLASASGDYSIKIWNIKEGNLIASSKSEIPIYYKCIVYSPDGLCLASASDGIENNIKIWNSLE